MNRDEYDDRDHSDELVMPFICVQSAGGPYDDRSFVAGFQLGGVQRALQIAGTLACTVLLYTEAVRQADLIAMAEGFKMDVLSVTSDGWTHVGFTKVPDISVLTETGEPQ